MRLTIGMLAEATDGPCGEVADVVVDPVKRRVTHLVVQPAHHHERARLVPVDAVVPTDADHVVLSWSIQQVQAAAAVQETDFFSDGIWPEAEGDGDGGVGRALAWPYFPYGGLGMGGYGYPYRYGWGNGSAPAQVTTTYDRIPEGTVEIRRASEVFSSDGHVVGHVDGFLVDPAEQITHLVLAHGHLWAHREITIPITDVARAESDTVQLRVTRDAVGEYPSVSFHRHGSAA